MTWTHLRANGGMRLEEQWIKRVGVAPACSLKRGDAVGTWSASIMLLSGISTVALHTSGTLEQAQRSCEKELREMGWRW